MNNIVLFVFLSNSIQTIFTLYDYDLARGFRLTEGFNTSCTMYKTKSHLSKYFRY